MRIGDLFQKFWLWFWLFIPAKGESITFSMTLILAFLLFHQQYRVWAVHNWYSLAIFYSRLTMRKHWNRFWIQLLFHFKISNSIVSLETPTILVSCNLLLTEVLNCGLSGLSLLLLRWKRWANLTRRSWKHCDFKFGNINWEININSKFYFHNYKMKFN